MTEQLSYKQLNLFTWQSERIEKGWKTLASFQFIDSIQIFNEVIKQDCFDLEAKHGIEAAEYFSQTFIYCETIEKDKAIKYLYSAIYSFCFKKSWGPQFLLEKLLAKVISEAELIKLFYIEEITIADIYIKIKQLEKAKVALINQLKTNSTNTILLIKLANTQWELSELKEANYYYLKALLLEPNKVIAEIIKNKKIVTLINKYGTEMAPAWGWIYGVFPLIDIESYTEIISKNKGCHAYNLLFLSENTDRKSNLTLIVNLRKQIKLEFPELYEAYFDLLKNRKI